MKISKNNIDTGKLLNDFIKKNNIIKAQLGRDIQRDSVAIAKYLANSSIQTGILLDICYALQHNFFQDIANALPASFTKSDFIHDQTTEERKLIASLREENKVLQIQNELLMKLKT